MDNNNNPFSLLVGAIDGRYPQPAALPLFGVAEVLQVEPMRVAFAGLTFERANIRINYTLEPYWVGAKATKVVGKLYGPTDYCPAGLKHEEKQVRSTDDLPSTLQSVNVEIEPNGLEEGDQVFVYYSQVDQLLVVLCKVV